VDAEEAVSYVLGSRQQPLQLDLLAAAIQQLDVVLKLRQLLRVLLFGGQLVQLQQVLHFPLQLLRRIDHRLQRAELRDDVLGRVLVIPESRPRHPLLQLSKLRLFAW
jgi:hypothetical protein